MKKEAKYGYRPVASDILKSSSRTGPGSDVDPKNYTSLSFYFMHTDSSIFFPAFITEFSDNYQSNWNSEQVYGRMDPIPIFKNTQRSISLGFKIIADTMETSSAVTDDLNHLIQNLYPKYVSNDNIKLLNSAPIARVKFGNLITNTQSGYGSASSAGLAGYITDFSASPDLEQGYMSTATELFPKQWNISFSFQVLHDETPGWLDDTGEDSFMVNKGGFEYPYGGKTPNPVNQALTSVASNIAGATGGPLAKLLADQMTAEILKQG